MMNMDCDHNNSLSLIEAAFHACIGNHDASLRRIQHELVLLEANGRLIELLLPASITQGETLSCKDEVFVAIGIDLSADDPLRWVLNDVNEKLERVPPVCSSMGFVFKLLLDALYMQSSHNIDNGGSAIGDDEGGKEDLEGSFYINEHDYDPSNHPDFGSSLYRSSNLEKWQSEKNDYNDSWEVETFERVLLEAEEEEEEECIVEKLFLEGKISNLSSNDEIRNSSLHAIKKEYINFVKGMKEKGWKSKNDEKNSEEDSVLILGGVIISIPDESNIWKWNVRLDPILFNNYPLYEDMQNYVRYKQGEEVGIELEFLFPPNYPFSPPLVKVVSPKLMLYIGKIGEGGKLCMDIFTESGWNPTYTFESVLVEIVHAIIQGDGRLDTTSLDGTATSTWDYQATEYSEMDCRMAFVLPSSDS